MGKFPYLFSSFFTKGKMADYIACSTLFINCSSSHKYPHIKRSTQQYTAVYSSTQIPAYKKQYKIYRIGLWVGGQKTDFWKEGLICQSIKKGKWRE